jgi:hypothetical protein
MKEAYPTAKYFLPLRLLASQDKIRGICGKVPIDMKNKARYLTPVADGHALSIDQPAICTKICAQH